MSRRDIILVSVFFNFIVLSVLFFTALPAEKHPHTYSSSEPIVQSKIKSDDEPKPQSFEPTQVVQIKETPTDVVDQVLNSYLTQEETIEMEVKSIEQELAYCETTQKESKIAIVEEPIQIEPERQFIEVVVKRGDALEKIARANRTTVREIRALNGLTNDRLDIGQVLLLPLKGEKKSEPKQEPTQEVEVGSYYTMKSGDNPWKVARANHVAFEELLKLNHLDEEKARSLRVGDRIRVR